MADVFISYARKDRARVRQLAAALEREGWSVWWDTAMLAGDAVHRRIEDELTRARCVVVVWSNDSISSDWVRDEADEARSRRVLVPVMIDNVKPPMGFRGFQAEDLTRWDGDPAAAALEALFTAVREVISSATDTVPAVTGKMPQRVQPAAQSALDDGRVHLSYRSEAVGQIVSKEAPLVIGVLGAFGGVSERRLSELQDRSFITVSLAQRDTVMARVAPRLQFSVPNRLGREGDPDAWEIELTFSRLADFEPAAVARRVAPLCWSMKLQSLLGRLGMGWQDEEQQRVAAILDSHLPPADLLAALEEELARRERNGGEQDVASGIRPDNADANGIGISSRLLDELLVAARTQPGRLARLDELIGLQLDEILHAAAFQQLESAWRGLGFLLGQCEYGPDVQVKILDVSKAEVLDELRGERYDQTLLFRKLYEEQYGLFDAAPFGLLLGDWSVSLEDADMELVEGMARIAWAAHIPFVAAAGREMVDPSDLAGVADAATMETRSDRWRRFRDSEDSRYVALTFPRILLRPPYVDFRSRLGQTQSAEGLPYGENVDASNSFLWGNSAYALAASIAQAFSRFGWFATIADRDGGGRVSQLPRYSGAGAVVGPTERKISDSEAFALAQAGLLPLVDDPRTASAAFCSDNTTHQPREFSDERATENERSDAKLSSVLTLTRFVQLMKIMERERIGSFVTGNELETWLNAWLQHYVAPRSAHETPTNAEKPLLDARVSIRSVQGLDGAYDMEFFLRPGYQFSPPRNLRIAARLMGLMQG